MLAERGRIGTIVADVVSAKSAIEWKPSHMKCPVFGQRIHLITCAIAQRQPPIGHRSVAGSVMPSIDGLERCAAN